MSIDMDQTVDLDELKDIQLYSYYFENVFSLEDFYLFRAVFRFYNKDYTYAIADFEQCQSLKGEHGKPDDSKEMTPRSDFEPAAIAMYSQASGEFSSINSSKTDLSDVGLCALNVHETNFNVLLCYLLAGQKKCAMSKVKEIMENAPKKYMKLFYLLRGLLWEEFGDKEKAKKDFTKFEKLDMNLH